MVLIRRRRRIGRISSSPLRGRLSRTREYQYALFVTLVVKITLFIFLWMLFATSIPIMRKSFKDLSETWRLLLPAAIAGIAILMGYHIFRNIIDIHRCRKEPGQAGGSGSRT